MKSDNIIKFIMDKYKFILIIIVILTIPLGYYFTQQEQYNQIEAYVDENDPTMKLYKKFRETYGSERIGAFVFHDDDIFTMENIEIIRKMTHLLEYTEGIQRVFSLTKFEEVVGIDDSVTFRKIIPEDDNLDEATLKKARMKALNNRTIVNFIVSKDGKTTGVMFEIEALEEKEKNELLESVRESALKIAKGKVKLFVTGGTYGALEVTGLMLRDIMILTPVTAIIIFLIILIMLRDLTLTILCQLNLMIILLWTIGFFVFCGELLNTVTGLIGSIILAIAVAVSIHFMSQYKMDFDESGGNHLKAIRNALKHVWIPCILTTATTAAGFIAFVTSKITPINKLGIYTSIGVIFAFVITMSFLPGVLIFFRKRFVLPAKSIGSKNLNIKDKSIDLFMVLLQKTGNFSTKNYKLIVVVSLIVLITSIVGISKITFESNTLEWLPEDNRVRVATNFVDKNLGGTSSMVTLIRAKSPEDDFTHPESLKMVNEIQEFLMNNYRGSTYSFSVANYFKEINKAFNKGDEKYYTIPDDRKEVIDFYEIGDPDIFERIITPDFMEARISVQVKWLSNDEIMSYWDMSSKFLEKKLGDKFRFDHTGEVSLWVNMEQDLLYSQIKSFSLAFVIIFFLMLIVCRTSSLTIVAMIPNIVPIALTLGFMGWAGIPLNSATVLVAAVTLGISVDVSIHFIVWVRRNIAAGMNIRDSLVKTYEDVGKPIVITTIVLFMGFFILIIGSMLPTKTFGILTGISMIIAMVSNLFILPSLILLFKPSINMLSDSEKKAHLGGEFEPDLSLGIKEDIVSVVD